MSVLFADLVGFTALSEQRDAEDVRELLSEYFAQARMIVERYGGTIEKFIGDAVMAVWGVPLAQEDDAERAVRAGFELVEAVSAFGEAVGAPGLLARAGVLTGEAAVNLGADGQGMVAGDIVNTASRVQSAAEPGTVLVGDATWRATKASILYEDAGTHVLKGKPEPAQLWRATRVIATRGGVMRPTGLEPPFVGRDRELRVLKELLHATSEEGRARLLSVVGEAGVGKSRLAWEFEKYVDGLSAGIWWHRGRCLSYGDGVAYSALAEMVRMRAGIAENEAAGDALQKLKTCAARFLPDLQERQWVEPRLAQLLGLEEVASADPRDLFAAWRVFFERLAAEDLTVLLFGDLQWADPGLLDFIDYLLDWSRSSPILVLTLSRPELAQRRPGWGTAKRGFTSLYLDPLSAEAMDKLLLGMVPGLPDELARRVREQAAGIPLYAVETVRMLLDRGLVVERDGVFCADASLEELEVPESLHALIAARLDSLTAEERQLAQDAAVLGKTFSPAALSSITAVTPDLVAPGLRALVDKDVLAIQSDPLSPERGQYVFVQDLVRTVAYGTLARRERKQRHLAVADYLALSWGAEDDIVEVLASHLVEAYDADRGAADAVEIRERARDALVGAAKHANSVGGPESACGYYERALELVDDDTARADLHLAAGRAAFACGLSERARQHSRKARDSYLSAGGTLGQARALHDLSLADSYAGDREAAVGYCEEALTLLGSVPADDETIAAAAEIEVRLARDLAHVGEFERALDHVERALRVADMRGLWGVMALGLDTKSIVLTARGQRFEGEILTRAAHRLAVERNLIDLSGTLATSLATSLEEDDQLQASLEAYEQATESFRQLGDRARMRSAQLNGMLNLLELGRWDEAAAIVDEYFEENPLESGPGMEFRFLLGNAVWLYLWRGDLSSAHRIVDGYMELPAGARTDLQALRDNVQAALMNAEGNHDDALPIAEATVRANFGGYVVDLRGALIEAVDAAFGLHRNAKVVELIKLVRDHLSTGRQPSIDAHVHRWEARLAHGRGDTDEADAAFGAAIEAFRALTRPFWIAVTQLEFAETLLAHARGGAAHELLTQARATFAELRAAPWLKRVDAAAHHFDTATPTTVSA